MIRTGAPIPTLGMIELASIAKGVKVADLMLKKAEVTILLAAPYGCGKYLIILTGDEASLLEAVAAGREGAGVYLENSFYIPNIHPDVVHALSGGKLKKLALLSLGIVESSSIASTIRSADHAAKRSTAKIVEITFALDLGGKGYFVLLGELGDVEASIEAAVELLREEDTYVHAEVIPAPHQQMGKVIIQES